MERNQRVGKRKSILMGKIKKDICGGSESVSGRCTWHTNENGPIFICNLMYFLILDNFVYRIQSLLLSAI